MNSWFYSFKIINVFPKIIKIARNKTFIRCDRCENFRMNYLYLNIWWLIFQYFKAIISIISQIFNASEWYLKEGFLQCKNFIVCFISELNFKYLIKLNFSVVEKIIQIRILERILGNSISIIKPCQFLKIYLDFEIKK